MKLGRFEMRGVPLEEIRPGLWRIEKRGKMRVGVHLVGSQALLEKLKDDKSIEQAMNVATLPGVLDPVLTMPDIHQGYGFPIGGVAAFRKNGVVSPGGVGYDINCGVRLLKTSLNADQLTPKILRALIVDLYDAIPCGVGSKRNDITLTDSDLEDILTQGSKWAVKKGFGTSEDVDLTEERGALPSANPDAVTERAKERGMYQLGTLGSGNHFVEIQVVDQVFDKETAKVFGLQEKQVVIAVHTGSRGLGYQTCADYLEESLSAAKKYGIELTDKELASAPLESKEGQNYLKAMAAAANFAFANRQVITHWIREVFKKHFGRCDAGLLYDVCHNIAKWEELPVGGKNLQVCIHRKGATRALPPKHPLVPPIYREVGQPILIPGDMGRYSFVLAGQAGSLKESFGSACHGAGRELSRAQAKKRGKGRELEKELEEKGIYVKSAGRNTVLEEMPEAYKDVTEVVSAVEKVEIAKKVVRLRPLGVVKG